uniref:Secreted protein n=1 Tax=Aegilops tauschii subsp. strangulata TaxID=200361 RepID=A0A453BIT7_AEGTS
MIIYVSFAMLMFMKIELIFSSNATLVAEYGLTCKLTGAMGLTFSNASPKPEHDLVILSSLRLCSRLHGIYGSRGMAKHSEGNVLLLPHGG